MSETISFTRHLTPTDRGLYLKIPFNVPEAVESLTITYQYPKNQTKETPNGTETVEVNTIDLGLYSTHGYLGESGSNRRTITIGQTHSDSGYAADDLAAGTWYVMAGVYRVAPEGVDVEYTVTFNMKTQRLLWGETHSHTTGSDGKRTFSELVAEAHFLKLDYLIVTDHNNYAQNDLITGSEPLTVIPGCEWTHYLGHANFIGVQRPLADPYALKLPTEIPALFEEAKANGALTTVNHAFDRNCGWYFDLDQTPFDLFEVWNGAVLPDDNAKAYQWWVQQLNDGQQMRIIGGADYHKTCALRHVGQPAVGVWTDNNTPASIMSAMKAGHTMIGYDHKVPTMKLSAGAALQGDVAPSGTLLEVEITSPKAGDELRIITDLKTETVVFDHNMTNYHQTFDPQDAKYCRLEIHRAPFSQMLKMPIALTNPIFFEK